MSDSLQSQEFVMFARAVCDGEVAVVREVLEASEAVRARINDPVFDFGQRALHVAARNIPMLDVLMGFGADVNLRSDWKNGRCSTAAMRRPRDFSCSAAPC